MKPDFALSLSFEGISLLGRAPGGWVVLGRVALDSDDLRGEMRVLRTIADDHGAIRGQVKLVIPNEQIRYLSLPQVQDGQDDAIRRALDGTTPYAVSDLAYDSATRDGMVHVAAVARETLDEAASFARGHFFDPVSFTARAPAGDFAGEVFFGPVPEWTGPAPMRDSGAIQIVDMPEHEIAALFDPDTGARGVAEAGGAPQQAARASHEAPADRAPRDSVTAQRPDRQRSAPASSEAQRHEPGPAASRPSEPAATPDRDKAGHTAPAAGDAGTFVSLRANRDIAADVMERAPAIDTTTQEDPARTAPRIIRRDPAAADRGFHPVAAPRGITASRTTDQESAHRPVAADAQQAAIASLSRERPLPESDAGAASAAQPGGFFSRRKAPSDNAPPGQRPDAPAVARPAGLTASREAAPERPGRAAATTGRRDPEARHLTGGGSAAVLDGTEDELQRMTIFGARQKTDQVGGKPRFLGLILTAALLLFLAGVAAWASVYLDEGLARFFRPDKAQQVAVAEVPASDPVVTDDLDEADVAALSPEPAQRPVDETEAQERRIVPALTEQEAAVIYAASGILQRAPGPPSEPQAGALEDLYVASIDPEVQQFDAVALPEETALREDVVYDAPRPPLPASVTFDLDDRGLVRATPKGAVNPDGVLVYAGLPPVAPPTRAVRDALSAPQPVEAPEAGAQPEPGGSRLEQFRPKLRPGGLIERNERATLSGVSRAELADMRPMLRPDVPVTVQEADVTATELAIDQSARPLPRPRNIQRIVQTARSAPQPQPVQVAAVAPRTVAPSIPSSTSVAKQATVRNAINLRQVNLIGVYGKPSSRRALVRLSNGRYQKVKVGDRIDGGTVAAIGDAELRYTKSGRNVTLTMPQG